jgi:hypothetical protein
MKKILMYVIIFAACVAFCEQRIDYTSGNITAARSPIALSFASFGAISFESRLDSWAKIDSAASPQELDQIAKTILNNLDLNTARVNSEDSAQISRREYQTEQHNDWLKLTVEADYQKGQTSIVFAWSSTRQDAQPGAWVPKLEKLPDWDWRHYYLYKAYLPGTADAQERQAIVETVMDDLQAKTKEIYADERASSLSGYSPALKQLVEPVWVGNHQINVQSAARSQSDGKTLLLIGTPLILGDY